MKHHFVVVVAAAVAAAFVVVVAYVEMACAARVRTAPVVLGSCASRDCCFEPPECWDLVSSPQQTKA